MTYRLAMISRGFIASVVAAIAAVILASTLTASPAAAGEHISPISARIVQHRTVVMGGACIEQRRHQRVDRYAWLDKVLVTRWSPWRNYSAPQSCLR